MYRPPFSYRFTTPFAALIVAAATAFILGTAELSHADEIEPEPVTDAPVAKMAPSYPGLRNYLSELGSRYRARAKLGGFDTVSSAMRSPSS